MTANAGQRKSTQAHSSQQRPMQGPRQPTQANGGHSAAILLHRYVFFNLHFIFYFFITTKPTKAHSSQRRPMQAHEDKKRPNLGLHLPSTTTNESRRLVGGYTSFITSIFYTSQPGQRP